MAEEPQGMPEFTEKITSACKSDDIAAMQKIFYTVDVPQDILEKSLTKWLQVLAGKYPGEGWTFSNVSFVPMATLLQQASPDQKTNGMDALGKQGTERSQKLGQEALEQLSKPTIDGQLYQYNLKVIGFVVIFYSKGSNQAGISMPVGIDQAGNIRLTLLKPKNG